MPVLQQSSIPAKAKPDWSDPETFARDIWPHAERAGRKLDVAPEAIVAQAALETGWGKHVMPDERGENEGPARERTKKPSEQPKKGGRRLDRFRKQDRGTIKHLRGSLERRDDADAKKGG